MARVFLENQAADKFGVISARLALIFSRPVKYTETAMVLSMATDEMLDEMVRRYNAANVSRESQTA